MKNYIKICGVEQTTLLLCFCKPVSKTGTGVELIEKKY
jgi:hypothetical protein